MAGRILTTVGLLLLGAAAEARPVDVFDHAAVMESLSSVHPRWRGRWLADRGLDNSYYATFHKPESTGLREIGRWPWGPSWELCGRDSLLFLGSGSGVRILSITDSVHPRMLGQIVARGLVSQVAVRDSLLFVACGGWGAQVYSVADPANPRELGSMDAVIGDLAVVDTFCYTLGGDSLKVYSIADPVHPARLSGVRESGYIVRATTGYAYCAGSSVMNVYDVRDPAQPQRVNARAGNYLSIFVRDTLLLHASYSPEFFEVLGISDPLNITTLGQINGVSADGMYADEQYAYLAYGGLRVVDISNPRSPVVRGTSSHYDVETEPFTFAPQTYCYLACRYGGLRVVDVHDVTTPVETTSCCAAGSAIDLSLNGELGIVASSGAGANTVDFSDPSRPRDLGWLNSVGPWEESYSVVLGDTFAFAGWFNAPYFRVIDVTIPESLSFVGSCDPFEFAQDMVLRDSLVYCVDDYKFEVINVARAREPRVVGTVNLPGMSREVVLADTLAYVAGQGMQVISVANPTNPRIIGSWDRYARGSDLQDTILYAVTYTNSTEDILVSLDVTNPASPAVIDSVIVPRTMHDVLVVDTVAYCVGWEVQLASVADPANLRLLAGRWSPPSWVRRVVYWPPYIYMCQTDAGVSIFETLSVGVGEPQAAARPVSPFCVTPTVTRGLVRLTADGSRPVSISLADASGRVIWRRQANAQATLDLTGLPDGVYFVRLAGEGTARARVTKVTRR